MEIRPAGDTGVSREPDRLPGGHPLAFVDGDPAQMSVESLRSAIVVHDPNSGAQAPRTMGVNTCQFDRPGFRSRYWGSDGSRKVHAQMVGGSSGGRTSPWAEQGAWT